MKILVCGPHGFLGTAFCKALPDAVGCSVDIADPRQVCAAFEEYQPDVVINCAGKTGRPNVDWCESNKLATARSNITGPLVLLEQCLQRNALLVHIGSGCIFEGDNQGLGFSEQDPPNYRGSYYSRSKISADEALVDYPVLILRLRMPFDNQSHDRNLINRLIHYRQVLDVPNSITYLPDFVSVACQLIAQRATGIYHVVNPGTISPYEIMCRYQTLVDHQHQFERLNSEGLAHLVTTGRSNCVLSTDKLERAGWKLQQIGDAVDDALGCFRTNARKANKNSS